MLLPTLQTFLFWWPFQLTHGVQSPLNSCLFMFYLIYSLSWSISGPQLSDYFRFVNILLCLHLKASWIFLWGYIKKDFINFFGGLFSNNLTQYNYLCDFILYSYLGYLFETDQRKTSHFRPARIRILFIIYNQHLILLFKILFCKVLQHTYHVQILTEQKTNI